MTSRAKKGKQRPAASAPSPAPASSARVETDAAFWAVDWSWTLLVASLVIVPLLITNRSWLPGSTGAEWFHGGPPVLKALVALVLIGLALVLFAVAVAKGRVVVRWHRVVWLGIVFVAWSGITVLTSVSPATALVGWALTGQGWLASATFATAGFLTLQLADSPARIRALLRAAALTAGAIAVYGLLQTAGLDPLKWQAGAWGLFRSFGTMGNPDMFGSYMVLALFVLIGLLLSESDKRWRVMYAAASLAVAAATFTSLTRAAWIGAVVGAVVFTLLSIRLHPKVTRANVIMLVVLVAIVAGAAAVSLSNSDIDSNVVSRVKAAFDPRDKNTLGRTETWRIAGTAIGKRPVFGYGPDTFGQAFQVNKTEQFAKLVDPTIIQANAHSAIIQVAVESGVPGAILWVALLVAVGVTSLPAVITGEKGVGARLLLAGVFASVTGYIVASLLTPANPDSSLLLWCMLAVLVSPVVRRLEGRVAARLVPVPVVAGSLAVAVGLAFLFANTRAAIADDPTVASPSRIAAADLAVRFDPLSAEFAAVAAKANAQTLLQQAAVNSNASTLSRTFDAALMHMRRAVALEPIDSHRRSTLVSLLVIGGASVDKRYSGEAVTLAAATVREAPNDMESAYWYGRALNAEGRSAQAISVLERVVRLRPGYSDAVILLSDLYVARGDATAARTLLKLSIGLAADTTGLQQRLDRLGK